MDNLIDFDDLSGPASKCFLWGMGLVTLCCYCFANACVIIGASDTRTTWAGVRLFPISLPDILFLLFLGLIAALGSSIAMAILKNGDASFPDRGMVISVFVMCAWSPVAFWANHYFRVTRKIRAWNYRTRFAKTIRRELVRWDKLYDYRRRVSLLWYATLALLAISGCLIFACGMVIDASGHPSSPDNPWTVLICGVFTTLWAMMATATRRRYYRKAEFSPKNWIRVWTNLGLVALGGMFGCVILWVMASVLGHLIGALIGSGIVLGIGMPALVAWQVCLAIHLDRSVSEQEQEQASHDRESDEQMKPETRPQPTRSAGSASIDELFAKPDEAVTTTEENNTEG